METTTIQTIGFFYEDTKDILVYNAIEYTAKTLAAIAGFHFSQVGPLSRYHHANRREEIVLTYGSSIPTLAAKRHIHVMASPFFQEAHYLRSTSFPREVFMYKGLPILYVGSNGMPPVIPKEENGNRKLVTSLDIFASTFFLLTRYEEVVSGGPLDEHDRFPASSSVLLKWNLLHRPLVNEYAELLKDWIRRVAPIFKFHDRNYRGHKFAVAVTRDIDAIRKYPRFPVRGIGGNILRRKIREAIQVASEATAIHVLRRRDPYDNLREILKWEKQIGIRSSIYLMASRGQRDASYDLTELTWNRKAILQSMLDGGWEIGFHPGYWTHGNEEAFQQQLATLRKQVSKTFGAEDGAIIGGRQHFLRFRPPYTWRIWEKAGLKYDSTLAFADHEGFRCGTCVPYKPFDVLDRREIDIWEVPLTVMDCTLDRYRGLSPQEAEETMDRLLEQVKKHRGVFVLLWHNSCFGRENSGPYHDVVARFITKALEEDAYVGPIRDVLFCLSEKFVD